MSRLIDAPIDVTMGPDGAGGLRPVAFIYRSGRHRIREILDVWVMHGTPWWEDPQAASKGPAEVTTWRVTTTQGGTFELIQDGLKWRLYKAYD